MGYFSDDDDLNPEELAFLEDVEARTSQAGSRRAPPRQTTQAPPSRTFSAQCNPPSSNAYPLQSHKQTVTNVHISPSNTTNITPVVAHEPKTNAAGPPLHSFSAEKSDGLTRPGRSVFRQPSQMAPTPSFGGWANNPSVKRNVIPTGQGEHQHPTVTKGPNSIQPQDPPRNLVTPKHVPPALSKPKTMAPSTHPIVPMKKVPSVPTPRPPPAPTSQNFFDEFDDIDEEAMLAASENILSQPATPSHSTHAPEKPRQVTATTNPRPISTIQPNSAPRQATPTPGPSSTPQSSVPPSPAVPPTKLSMGQLPLRGGGNKTPSAPAIPIEEPTPTFHIPLNTVPEQVELQLVSSTTFAVSSTANECLKEVYAQIPGATFTVEESVWQFPLTEYNSLLEILYKIPHVNVHALPQHIAKVFVSRQFRVQSSVNLDKIPPGFLSQLLPYQKEGVIFALQRGGKAMICDEMGLGKTAQAIAVSCCYPDEWPILIICPSSLRSNWQQQYLKWLPHLSDADINVIYTGKNMHLDGRVNIISFDLASTFASKILSKRFKIVIIDESHLLKNLKTARTKNIVPIVKSARRSILLSGTPAVSRPVELFPQLMMLQPSQYHFHDFTARYCDGHAGQFGYECKGATHLRELHLLLRETIMIRRLKDDVLNQLPPKTRKQVAITISDPEHARILRKAFSDLQNSKRGMFSKNARTKKNASADVISIISDLFQSSGTSKIPAVLEYVKEQLDGNRKFLVFAYHQNVIKACCHMLNSLNIDHIRIDGHTQQKKRQGLVDRFQENEECRGVLEILLIK